MRGGVGQTLFQPQIEKGPFFLIAFLFSAKILRKRGPNKKVPNFRPYSEYVKNINI
jgi:hypothetical protein